MAYELRLPAGDAKRRIGRGRSLRTMPHTARARAAVEITARQFDRLVRAGRRGSADAFAEAETDLVEQARHRELDTPTAADGMGRLDGCLPPLEMAEFTTELDRLEHDLFEQDWKQARTEHGAKATTEHLARTPAQRRALVEMSRRSAACGLTGPAPTARIVVNVHTDQVTLLASLARLTGVDPATLPDDLGGGPVTATGRRFCELAAGTPIAGTDLLLAALCGRVRRVLYDADGRIVDHGRAQRLFTGALREAVGPVPRLRRPGLRPARRPVRDRPPPALAGRRHHQRQQCRSGL